MIATTPIAMAQNAVNPTQAARYSALHSGDAVLVFRHDSLVFEQYQNGWKAEEPHQLASGTKTFACVLSALAEADGLMQLDHPRESDGTFDQPLVGVSDRQLLNLTSGYELVGGEKLKQTARPGQRFKYDGVSFAIYAGLLSEKLKGEDLLAYLRRRVLDPIGVKVGSWERDGRGIIGLASGAALTARDWGKFGVLLLQRGKWGGRQLVPAAGLAECGKGSDANPYYGMGLWLNPAQPTRPAPAGVQRADSTDRIISAQDLPHDLLLAAGSGGQRLYILPTQGLVVVRFGHNTGPDYRDDEFLRLLLR